MHNMTEIFNFIEKHWLALNLLALALFVGSIVVSVFIILKLPQNYWLTENYRKPSLMESLLRNIVATVFFWAGVAMLFLPGQGIITIVISFLISHVPYKRRLIRYFISKPKVQKGFDYIRTKFGKPCFTWPK
ncbi:MAG: hypothetical protein MK008_01790 [Bdellovibrionales bacterium]|nr:hypothetical protein [Bdellovibrionales bacterium]